MHTQSPAIHRWALGLNAASIGAGYILGTEFEPMLAEVASTCSSVIVCRASPSQKAGAIPQPMYPVPLATQVLAQDGMPGPN